MRQDFDAYVTGAIFDAHGTAAFALGDGTIRFEDGESTPAHDGAVLCAVGHPSGEGLVSGGDDGRVIWTKRGGAQELAQVKGRWIDSLAISSETGLLAFGAGRDLHVRDLADPAFARTFTHEKSIAAIAFDPKGRRIATATYNGAALWYARIAEQKPQILKWAGSHTVIGWSPDGKFLITAMQENQLHGWRLSDSKDLRMGGYPAKVKSLVFLDKGLMLATSGANGVVIWPFVGAGGPMGKEAAEIGFDETALVTRVAATPGRDVVVAGLDDGRVWTAELRSGRMQPLKSEKGAQITALAVSADGRRAAWGDEDGGAGVIDIPSP